VLGLQGQPNTDPFIITIMDPPSDIEGLGDVLLGALGITGVIVAAALVTGIVLAGAIYLFRRFRADDRPGPVV